LRWKRLKRTDCAAPSKRHASVNRPKQLAM
jgi:hypothetical protein